MFTARIGLEPELRKRFVDALLAMHFENPAHKPILEAEGLKQWIIADVSGYDSLQAACAEQGLFRRSNAVQAQ